MSRRRKRISHSVPFGIFKKFVLILLVLGLPCIIFINTFSITKLEVIGTKRYQPEQITKLLMNSKLNTNTLYFYLNYTYFTKLRLPFIEKIDVTMDDTHSITVYVYEKMVAGCVEFMGEYMYFDKDGIVVEGSAKRLEDVPIIKGLNFSKIILNEKIELADDRTGDAELSASGKENKQENQEQKKKPEGETKEANEKKQTDKIFRTIIRLTQLIDKYDLAVDTVTFNKSREVILECGDITVLLGKKDTYDEALSELKNILAEVSGRSITIDLRNYVKGKTHVIAKPKE
jgi:cell division protein FtsQ